MTSPRRVSPRKSGSLPGLPTNGLADPATIEACTNGKAPVQKINSPIKAETTLKDRSPAIELVGSATSSSSTLQMEAKSQVNGATETADVKTAVIAVATRLSSEELTDLEELDKALASVAKKPSQRKRKAKGKEVASQSGSVEAAPGKDGIADTKPKVKRKRTKKIQGPYLPTVTYPRRDLDCKKFVGAHVSISEGAHYAPHRALNLGARAFGLFVKSQRKWAGKPLTEDSIKLFPLRCAGKTESEPNEDGQSSIVQLGDGLGYDPLRHIVPHGSYLTNLCHSGNEQRKKSYENFLTELKMSESLGIGLFNFHPGSTLGQPREEAYRHLADCINDAHKETKFITVLLENMASRKNIVGGSFEDLAAVIALVEDKNRIGVCFDTCHAFAAGYDLRSEDAFNATWKQFDDIVGLQYLKAFHVNDSMKDLGSGRDLHQNIGAGELGLSAFHLLMRDPRFDNLPFILETPMLSGNFNTDGVLNATNGQATTDAAAMSSKLKLEMQSEEDLLAGDVQTNADDADIEDNIAGDGTLGINATTWKREIDLLQELEKVPFGQTNETIEKLSSEIGSIVAAYRKKQEKQQKAAKQAKDAIKEAKKAAQLAENGAQPEPEKEKRSRAPKSSRKEKAAKVEAKEEAAFSEMEIDSSEVDQLASDYEG